MDPRMMMGQGQSGGQSGGQGIGMGGLNQFLGGIFGNSGAPFGAGMDQLQKYYQQAQQVQNPFLQAGQGAIAPYQNMLGKMSNPQDFYKNIMSGYQQSPAAQYQQQQGMRSANNFGSASGLMGSTPLMQQAQQNAQNISSGDMQNYFNNIMGVNQGAMNGYGNMMNMGQGSANTISELLAQLGQGMGQGAYGQQAGQQQNQHNMIGGLLNMFGNGLFG
jgi:hypothetical protein